MERMCWATGSQEAAVERFYGQGAADFGEFHGGYLNFGLWEKGVGSYLQAAENLVHRLGTLLGLTGSSRLLDVACGMGTQDVYLFDHFGQPEIDAIDITWPARLRAARTLPARIRRSHPLRRRGLHSSPQHRGTRPLRHPREVLPRDAPGSRAGRRAGPLRLHTQAPAAEPDRAPDPRRNPGGVRIPKENLWTTDEYRRRLSAAGFADVDVQEVGALTIPGYFFEQRRPEVRRELARIRGFVAGRLGHVIDLVACGVYRMGLAEYVLVRARKPR